MPDEPFSQKKPTLVWPFWKHQLAHMVDSAGMSPLATVKQ